MTINNIFESTLSAYPIFKPNQVLTNGQLNNIVEYLDGQNRLTRVLLLGTGIACGFEPLWVDADKALHVSAGFGVTSDGYLIHHEKEEKLNIYRRREVSVEWLGFKNNNGLPSIFKVEELLTGAADATENKSLIDNKNFLINKVLIYVLELNNQDNLGLCNNDCDARNATLQFNLHKLLFSEADALLILAKTYEIDAKGVASNLEHKFYEKYFMKQLAVPRFGYGQEEDDQVFSVNLDKVKKYGDFLAKYQAILEKYVIELSIALQQANLIFSPVLTPGETTPTVINVNPDIVTKINNKTYDILEVQYLYDHLADLTDAYNEFVDIAFDLIADCNHHPKYFPNHLMVRKFNSSGDPETEPYSVFHTPYTQTPIYNGNAKRLEEVRTLFQRLIDIARDYTTPSVVGKDEIKITPSKSFRAPLSQRAIPYYYRPALADVWSPRQNQLNRKGQIYSYHRSTVTPPYTDPLVYEMQGSDFFRIEGHIGQDFMEVMTKLSNIQQKYNLPFSTIALKIDTEFDGELFQFECENFECELQEHREKYARIQEEFQTNVIDQLPIEAKTELGKAEFNKRLTTNLDEFSYNEFEKVYLQFEKREFDQFGKKFSNGFLPPQQKLPFKQVNECFLDIKDRITEIKNRHLFHHFSKVSPGMEHKGGVPFGGTFILAYVESTEIQSKINEIIAANPNDRILAASIAQRRIVVADFYLPYNCCSNCPPICYVVARPKPIFTVTPSVFCLGDTSETQLNIVAHPGGGKISGAGYLLKGGEDFFVPAKAGKPDANGQVKLYYSVDGAEAVVLLSLVPPPNADFEMLFDDEPVTRICEGQGAIQLNPIGIMNGQFFAIQDGTVTPIVNGTYDPSDIVVPRGAQVQVTIRYVVRGNYCNNQIEKTLTILPLPNPAFKFGNNVTEICTVDVPLLLIPEESGGVFAAFVGNTPAPGAIIRGQGNSSLQPKAFAPAPGQSVTVRVVHTIASSQECPNSTEQTIQIFAPPTADFTIQDQNKRVCQTAAPVKLTITPPVSVQAVTEFTAEFNSGDQVVLQNNQFDPSIVANPAERGTEVTIRLTVTQGPCRAASTEQTILVLPAPEIGFDADFTNQAGTNFTSVRVTNIKKVPGGSFKWTSVPPALQPINPPANATSFDVQYPRSTPLPINLSLTVEREGCSTPLTKSLMPSVQRFDLLIPDPENGDAPGTLVTSLTNGAEIPLSRLINDEVFQIRALTIPNIVQAVEMNLSGAQNRLMKVNSPGNYLLDELPPQAGSYTIRAIPFAHNDQAGIPLNLSFSILNDLLQIVEPTEDTINFLRKRDNTYRSAVKDLEANEALAQTPAFQLANGFVSFQGTPEEFNARYKSTSVALMQAAGQATRGSVEHKQILSLMSIATRYFMDKQVFQATDQLAEETIKTLKDQLADMKKAGVKIASLKTSWDGNALKKQLSAPSVDAIQELLK